MNDRRADSPVWRALNIPLEQLDDLPFGAIVIDELGTIHEYNEYETRLSHMARENVIGKNFFRDVAPCTAVQAFEGRLRDFLRTKDRVSESFEYFFPVLAWFGYGGDYVLAIAEGWADPDCGGAQGARNHLRFLTVLWVAVAMSFAAPIGAQSHAIRELARRRASQPSPAPSPIATPLPRATPHPERTDEAYWLVGGEWSCKTFAGSTFTRTYSRDQDAVSIVAQTIVTFRGRSGKLMEIYRKHRRADKWEVSLVGGQLIVIGSPWYRREWTFDGHDSESDFDGRVTMTYHMDAPDMFTREFARFRDGKFVPYAGEHCTRRPT